MDFANQVIKVDITENNKEAKQQDDSSIDGFMSMGSLPTFCTEKLKPPTKI